MNITLLPKLLSPTRGALLTAVAAAETIGKVYSLSSGVRTTVLGFGGVVLAYSVWKGVHGWQYFRTIRAIGSPLRSANQSVERLIV